MVAESELPMPNIKQLVLKVTVKTATQYNLSMGSKRMDRIESNYFIIFKMKSTTSPLIHWPVNPIPTNT